MGDRRVGAGGDEQPLAHIGFPRRLHGVALRGTAGDLAEGLLHLHVVGLQGRLDPGHQGTHHLVLALDHLAMVDGKAAGGDPVFFPMLHTVVELGAIQQGLGGHAALVQAHAPKGTALQAQYLHAAVAGPLRRQIARRAAAQHDQIIYHIPFLLIRSRGPGSFPGPPAYPVGTGKPAPRPGPGGHR